ncbi:MtrAB system accessory lipoprotein LpqB [Corynebacterium frankenforstense]|uniref:MtrAB system accessory lipoprotein LpqB n=1 Tax=Corynebacterium frankenforstense TaxID=1230998 RepID=UPI0026EA709D|nr:MtrAB system accessory lipoprotein LpqB [Corynebacterium frankenforstense]
MRNRRTRLRAAVAVVTCAGMLASCSSLPRNSEPNALRPFAPNEHTEQDLGPTPDQEPDLLLREFYTAAARPTQDYQAARGYLAGGVAQRWTPQESTLVVDRIDINTQAGANADERTFDVRGTVIGRLDSDGAYSPDNGTYEASVTLRRQDDGQWRITALPDGVVFERTELRNNYEPHRIFFFDPAGRVLVGDRRWVYSGERAQDAALINLLVQGPASGLEPGVRHDLPEEASFLGTEDGVYRFAGMGSMSPEQRIAFAAQLVWTLAEADIPGPYAIEADGAPLAEGYRELTTDDFAAFNPETGSAAVAPLYALSDGNLLKVSGAGADPVPGELGTAGDIASADVSVEDVAAVVRRRGNTNELWMGGTENGLTRQLTGQTLTRPTIEPEAAGAWTVVDGDDVVRLVRSNSTGAVARTSVRVDGLGETDSADEEISVLQLSRTGVRVAMIVDGRVYLGVVAQRPNGERSVVNVTEIAAQLDGTAVSLDWQADGSLVVGTSSAESPLWRVEQDGSSLVSLPSGNVTAPVVAVASGQNTLYLTDALAMRQLPANGTSDSAFWREVPGLQGVRSAPVVAH